MIYKHDLEDRIIELESKIDRLEKSSKEADYFRPGMYTRNVLDELIRHFNLEVNRVRPTNVEIKEKR